MIFLLRLVSYLPLPVLYTIAWLLHYPLRKFYRRKLVLANLRLAFPTKTPSEISALADKFYHNFSQVVVEVVKSVTISEKQMRKRVMVKNPEIAETLKKQNKPLLLLGSHMGNWEWLGHICGFHMTTPADVIYKPLQNKKADEFTRKMRSRFGANPVSKDVAARVLLRKKNKHGIFALIADQSPPREHVYWTYLFGVESDFYPGIIQMPYLLQVPVYYGKVRRLRKGYYELEFVPIGEPPYEKGDYRVLKEFVQVMEEHIKKYPEDYLWTHNRWKHTRTENEEIINFSST